MESRKLSRRGFLSGVGAGAFAFTFIKPELVRGSKANSRIDLGVIGCGGRGTWITDLFKNHGGYNIAAAADYFQERVDKFGDKFNVPASKRFTTLSGYKRVLDCKVDALAIESPPYFHPEQARAGVAAGVNVYLAKPVAVDVPGCKNIEACGKEATRKQICFLVDFQTRANDFFKEAISRVRQGAIGNIVFGEAAYHCGRLEIQEQPGSPEARLKNWVFDKALSGDIITEQNIHTLDVMSWIMKAPPVHATGVGGRKVRTDVGDCLDYFTLVYEYPNQVGITFSSRQFDAHGSRPEGIRNRMFGTEGTLETQYGGKVFIRGKNFYKGGNTINIYQEGAANNIDAFYNNITKKNYENSTVAESVRSNLVTILGRTAAYQNRRLTWKELLRNSERLDGRLKGLKS